MFHFIEVSLKVYRQFVVQIYFHALEHQLFHYLYLPWSAVCNVDAPKTASFHNLKCYGRYKYFSFLHHVFGTWFVLLVSLVAYTTISFANLFSCFGTSIISLSAFDSFVVYIVHNHMDLFKT